MMLNNSILTQLQKQNQDINQPLNLGIYYKNTLVSLCHALEDFVLESQTKPIIIAAFQLGKWYLEEANRYQLLADKADHITIMAALSTGFEIHPTSQIDNVCLVNLDLEDPVAQEWHLIIYSPSYTAMVLCQELSQEDYGIAGKPEADLQRKFYGFWTYEPELVREAVALAINHIGNYNPQLQQKLLDKIELIDRNFTDHQRDDLGLVVSKVVSYLQDSQQNLINPQVKESSAFSQELDNNLISNELQAFLRMAQFIDQSDLINQNAASEVAALGEAMGQLLDLPAWQLKRLKLASLLHRLLPFQSLIQGDERQTLIQKETVKQQDNLPKAFVLRIMPQLQAIAEIISHQTELWDGSGQPDGLAYDHIPLESRILGLLIYFQNQSNNYQEKGEADYLTLAYNDCKLKSGTAFDPKLVEVLEILVMAIQQGLNIPVIQPKIASGIWLLSKDLTS
jgi:DICT domain-containing protein